MGNVDIHHRILVADIANENIIELNLLESNTNSLDLISGSMYIGEEDLITSSRRDGTVRKVVVTENHIFPGKPTVPIKAEVVGIGEENLVGIMESSNPALTKHAILVERTLIIADESKSFIQIASLKEFDQKVGKLGLIQ